MGKIVEERENILLYFPFKIFNLAAMNGWVNTTRPYKSIHSQAMETLNDCEFD